MYEIDVVEIRKKAKLLVLKKSVYKFAYEFIYFFFKFLYRLLNIASLGLLSVFISSIFFPITIIKSKKKLCEITGQQYVKFLPVKKYFSKIGLKFLINLTNFVLFLFFVVPGVIFWLNFTPLSYIIADNIKLNNKQAIQKCKEFTKNRKTEILSLYLPFSIYFVLSIVTFGISSFYFANYFTNTKALYYIKLKETHEYMQKQKTSLL